MSEAKVRVHVIPWDDPAFHAAVSEAWDRVCDAHVEIEGRDAASIAESRLRQSGYPEARVEYERGVTELMHGTAQWTIHRDTEH